MIQQMSFPLNKMRDLLIKVKINPLFWLVLGIGVATGYFREVLMVFLIVFIHELGHAFAAIAFKWRIYKIELLPFGGVAEVDHGGNRPIYEEAIVVIAGPLQHLWMMLASFACIGLPFWSAADHQLFVWHNLMILGFNLIPILPLDGGRLLHLWLTAVLPYQKALLRARQLSIGALVLLVLLSAVYFPFHLNLWVVISFLLLANYFEWKQRHYHFMRFLMTRSNESAARRHSVIRLKDSLAVRDAVKQLRRGYRHDFRIYRRWQASVAHVTEAELVQAFFQMKNPHAPLSSFPFAQDDRR
ncbi:M50 family metallopeptidase [Halalkalibacter oceani]|uniref:M50 family metallopeptidase n=2 Tax=Halalkalibacter oceani TaxID=1653776 RepID=UPI003399331F